jgi:hypothetical protein
MRLAVTRGLVLVLFGGILATASSCEPIVARPLVSAPMNRCPCDAYERGASTAPTCTTRDRCEIGGRPEYPLWIVVHVPDSSIFAPGMTYVLVSDAQGNPAFKEPPVEPGVVSRCRQPLCLPLDGLVGASGSYQVRSTASREVGYPLADLASIPVRVVYEPLGNDQQETFPPLPLQNLFASSRIGATGVDFSRAVPVGRYRRVLYPAPPFDEFFPPQVEIQVIPDKGFYLDSVILGGDKQLDDVGGDSRTALIKRAAGLDGWRAWLVDRPSQRRISVIRTLSGAQSEVTLFTTGEQRAPGGGLGDDVEAVVAPPDTWTAVPRYVTRLFGGAGLKTLNYPAIPPPVTVGGVVAQPEKLDGVLLGYSARITFESEALSTNTDSSTLLRYSTTVSTDDRGRFATVLPPGTYIATIEPAEGTGYAKQKQVVLVDRALTALTLQPPPRTVVKGRAVLTDGRPLAEADVVAIPSSAVQATPLAAPPRPGRTWTDEDGRYAFELDPGSYELSVIPRAGTGFPRVVVRPDIPGSLTRQETELPDVRVPAPIRLSFTLRDPSPTANPIANAVVRIFATPALPGGAPASSVPVEIGSSMTDSDGLVEILLAQEPR